MILDPKTCINRIDRFFKSYILPDLLDQIIDYITKVDQIYLAISWKKQGSQSFLLQSPKRIESLSTLLLYLL